MRLLALLALLLTASAFAEPRVSTPTNFAVVRQATRSSGMIFSGVVLQLRRPELGDAISSATQITFRVENAIRGVRRGQIVRISEWSGLWNSGERYMVGERLLLFLYPKSKLGLTSPVGGSAGRYAVDSAGNVLMGGATHTPRPVPLKSVQAEIRRAIQE